MNYRLVALLALLRAIRHVLFDRDLMMVQRFGSVALKDGELAISDCQFAGAGPHHIVFDGVSSVTHEELLKRATRGVAIYLLLAAHYSTTSEPT